jgi:hypothetical protein
VPAYAESLERVLGPGALDRLLAELEARSDGVLSDGRRLFERWLGAVHGLDIATVPL